MPENTAAPEATQAEAPVETPAENVSAEQTTEKTETPVAEAPKVEKRKYKYKANGEEKEEELTDDDVVKALAKAAGADEKFREAASTREKIMGLVEELKKNPVEALSSLGVDFRKAAEEYLTKIYKEEELPEHERLALQYKRKMEEVEKKEKELTDKEQREIIERETEKYVAEYDKAISDAIQSSDLPKTRSTVRRIASYLERAVSKGVDVDVKDIIPIVREDYINEFKETFGNADEKQIMDILGKDKAAAVSKAVAQSVIVKPDNKADASIQPKNVAPKSKKVKWTDLEKELDARLGK